MQDKQTAKPKKSLHGAYLVAIGILFSRLTGLVRMRALAHFLGNSEAADAFYAAVKIPNFPQNLLGEGVLSASFIPVYANLIAKGDKALAGKVAGVILSLLATIVAVVVFLGIVLTPYLIDLIAPGFHGEKRDLTIHLVQIIFPGTGLLVLSAWCLGILNSHHKFFLSYVAPVVSNLAVVVILFMFRHEPLESNLAEYAAWGIVVGALAQLLLQLPTTLKLIPEVKLGLGVSESSIREIIKNFVPVVISRGVVQLSAYIDSILASFLPSGAVAALGYAQAIYMLPISLFGMSVSAAELPSMSQAYGNADFHLILQKRINAASRKIAYFVVPSVAAFLFLGDIVAGLLFQTGQFNHDTSIYVWTVLAGSSIGLLASTLGRLYSSAFYSLRDTKTPLRFSVVRVFLTGLLGYLMGLILPKLLNVDSSWGTAGLTASAGIAGWVEFYLLRRKLNSIIGPSGLDVRLVVKLWIAAILSAGLGFLAKLFLPAMHPFISGLVVVAVFGVAYFPLTRILGIEESKAVFDKLLKRRR
jgi:putative peptidoglycan lipid II flippase